MTGETIVLITPIVDPKRVHPADAATSKLVAALLNAFPALVARVRTAEARVAELSDSVRAFNAVCDRNGTDACNGTPTCWCSTHEVARQKARVADLVALLKEARQCVLYEAERIGSLRHANLVTRIDAALAKEPRDG